jgi:hypothetical protein
MEGVGGRWVFGNFAKFWERTCGPKLSGHKHPVGEARLSLPQMGDTCNMGMSRILLKEMSS